MISFLIPIYNRNVTKLVRAIYDQARALDIEFEILCYDDGSKEKYKLLNRPLGSEVGISYMELSQNLGRSRIRNWLGKNARYDNLVFLDCDQYIPRKSFVQKYIHAIGKADVVYGGRIYAKRKPGKKMRLHWKYGSKIEAQSVSQRNKNPYRSFLSNNFMIARDVFVKHLFDESVQGYGYEDTLIGHELKQEKRSILHIDNPVTHVGLEKTSVYLSKTENAVKNLVQLYKNNGIKTRMTEHYDKMLDWGLVQVFLKVDQWFGEKIDKKLYKENPALWAFQWFKLRKFIQTIHEK